MSIKPVKSKDLKDRHDKVERKKKKEEEESQNIEIINENDFEDSELIKLSDYRLIFDESADVSKHLNHKKGEKSKKTLIEFNGFILVRKKAIKQSGALTSVVPFQVHVYREGQELYNSGCDIFLENFYDDPHIKEYVDPKQTKLGEVLHIPEKAKNQILSQIDARASASKRHNYGKRGILVGLLTAGGLLGVNILFAPAAVSNIIGLVVGGLGGVGIGAWAGKKYHDVGSCYNFICCNPEKFPKLASYNLIFRPDFDPDNPDFPIKNDFNAFILVNKQKKSKIGAAVHEYFKVYIYKNGVETKNSRTKISLKDIKMHWMRKFLTDTTLRDKDGILVKPKAQKLLTEYTHLLRLIQNRAQPVSIAVYTQRGRIIGVIVGGILIGVNFGITSGIIPIVLAASSSLFVGIERGYNFGSAYYNMGGIRGITESCCEGVSECAKGTKNCFKNCGKGITACCKSIGSCISSVAGGFADIVTSCCSGTAKLIGKCCSGIGSCFSGIYNCTKNLVNKCKSGCEKVKCSTSSCKCCNTCNNVVINVERESPSTTSSSENKRRSEKSNTGKKKKEADEAQQGQDQAQGQKQGQGQVQTQKASNAGHARRLSTMVNAGKNARQESGKQESGNKRESISSKVHARRSSVIPNKAGAERKDEIDKKIGADNNKKLGADNNKSMSPDNNKSVKIDIPGSIPSPQHHVMLTIRPYSDASAKQSPSPELNERSLSEAMALPGNNGPILLSSKANALASPSSFNAVKDKSPKGNIRIKKPKSRDASLSSNDHSSLSSGSKSSMRATKSGLSI